MIRFIGVQDESAPSDFVCIFTNANRTTEVALKENFPIYNDWPSPKLLYKARMFGCLVPDGAAPISIDVSLRLSAATVTIPVSPLGDIFKGRKELALCVKGIWGQVDPVRLVEWVEFNRILGVQKIVFYDAGLSGDAVDVVKYYKDSSFVDVENFALVKKFAELAENDPLKEKLLNPDLAMEQAYLVSLNDCYYSRRNSFKYVLLLDIDEVVIPSRSDETLLDVIEAANVEFPAAASFNFHTVWHMGEYGFSSPSETLFMQRNLHRSNITRSQPKAIINTDRSVTINWHGSVTQPPRLGLRGNAMLPWRRYGLVHHYREKCKHHPDRCRELLREKFLDIAVPRYKTQVLDAVRAVLHRLQISHLLTAS
jgi:hypothetical protein